MENVKNIKMPAGGPAAGKLARVLLLGGAAVYGLTNCLFNVEGGHRAIVFNRFGGIKDEVYEEGTHLMVPWFERPIIYDVRARPNVITSTSGSRDLQMVNIGLRVLTRPMPSKLPEIYRTLGTDYAERVLPSIIQETLKSVIAQYNASQLLTMREVVSRDIRRILTQRARYFNIVLDDVSITQLTFSREYTGAVEAKQVAQQDAERAKFIVEKAEQDKQSAIIRAQGEAQSAMLIGQAVQQNPAFLTLRKIEAAREIASTVAASANRIFLNSDSLLLNLADYEATPGKKNFTTMSRPPGPLAHCLLTTAALLLLLAVPASCDDDSKGGWKPFRPTDGSCHEIGFTLCTFTAYSSRRRVLLDPSRVTAVLKDGLAVCAKQLGSDWKYSRSQEVQRDNVYIHYCRRCGLPKDSLLMWFGRAPNCQGSCPSGWRQVTPGVRPHTPSDELRGYLGIRVDSDPSQTTTLFSNSYDFGVQDCLFGPGKVLCALGGRPASAQCSYTWRGTAPDCRDACEAGETLVAKDPQGDGKLCLSGTYNKMLCERCQSEILNLNDCTTPMWFGRAPLCAGECNVGDRVMARAQSQADVPSDQDPGGFGKTCSRSAGWKVRCHLCSVRGQLGSGKGGQPTCTAPKAGHVWPGTPVAVLKGVQTYQDCCRECNDRPECRRFHVGGNSCSLFVDTAGAARPVPARGGHAGSATWQAGTKQV
ncbi:prohibitin- mitochondrial-like [Chlorella sorokiniana]|uniref:Prohibitin-mitochondrial-like n=1 Tax=Chlorella sorokiniana TaxID=3076 RepID=A0A2P6TYV5_CHLSO|nr:prohibitin- mitochondrial-like [Chlorella sorokiniana]|eukprot:PRW59255.1 prohibitin- mitochondrial-like [Chlorella sorokiniana]